ncbi:Hypothetical predicted protein, partial [Pelobates cultripes]
KIAPASPSSESTDDGIPDGTPQTEILTQRRTELATISDSMLTRAHSEVLIQEFCPAMREELAGLRSDLTTLDTRVEASVAQICQQRHRATEIAATHQGNMLLTLRRQVEDLENRS